MSSASTITTLANKRMDTDSQVRLVLDRMALDFAQMIRRSDVDSYLKGVDPEVGNDRLAFFSQIAGYYSISQYTSPVSLIAYRVNGDSSSGSFNKLERMGKGLLWNTASTTYKSLIFGPKPGTLTANWPYVADNTSPDPDSNYETMGPQIFRFEYCYLLKGQTDRVTGTPYGWFLGTTPWDTRITGHTNVSGMQDVTAVIATLASIDPKSRYFSMTARLEELRRPGSYSNNGLVQRLVDFDPATHTKISDLPSVWQTAIDGTTDMIRPAIAGIRIYQRSFYLSPKK